MASQKNLYTMLKEQNLIVSEEYTFPLQRGRWKASGCMWEGAITVTLKDGSVCRFEMWANLNDQGGNWIPSEKELNEAWRESWIPKEPASLEGCYPPSYGFYVNDHYYVSRRAFGCKAEKDALIDSVKNGILPNNVWKLV